MKIKFSLFALIIWSLFFTFSNTACTQEKVKEVKPAVEQSKQATSEPEAPKVDVKVAFMGTVTAPQKGKAAEFDWSLDGKTVKFSELTKGKVVFLNFWGTWCPPCRREIPDLVEIAKELKDKDFIMIGIPQERDPSTAKEAVSAFAQSKSIPYLNVIDKNYDLAKAYGGINAVPTTMIIDKKGNVVETITGMRGKKEFMESINKVLK